MPITRKLIIAGKRFARGTTTDLRLKVSETYTGDPMEIPVRVIRAKQSGPVLLLTAAIHGDEINGTGIIRELVFGQPPQLVRGTLICAPVVNLLGFENQHRYTPDRRDLNRSFPGSPNGSMASRVANVIFRELIANADYCIDFHSAAIHRTNYPNVRADLSIPAVRELAEAFGVELIVKGKGPEGSFRRSACAKGCPTIILEAGEVAKIEPAVLEVGLRGINNVLAHLEMIKGNPTPPRFQAIINKTSWVRAELGGLLRFHVAPGEPVTAGQAIATNESVFGDARSSIISPSDGIVLGMTTNPAVKPGEPVCHIAHYSRGLAAIRKTIAKSKADGDGYVHQDLRAGIAVHNSAAPGGNNAPVR